jgi:hypothetical protein
MPPAPPQWGKVVIMTEKFIICFQTEKTEHKVACNETEVEEIVEFHKARGHVVCVVPQAIAQQEEFC